MNKKTIRDIDLYNKTVIMRVDFNVPLENGKVTDNSRIKAAIASIEYILSKGKALILMSHLGRPKGKIVPSLSLKPVAKELSTLLNAKVVMMEDCIGTEVREAAKALKKGDILLLENLRFHAEEKQNNLYFAKELSELGDVFVNDAFGTTHRAHASTKGIADYLPAISGFLVEKELLYLTSTLDKPKKPFVAIIGGAKVSTKISVLAALLDKVDTLIIGGGMSYTFAFADGWLIGNSLLEQDAVETARALIKKAIKKKVELIIPVDHVIADKIDEGAIIKTVTGNIPDGFIGVDIGTRTIELIKLKLKEAKTVLWNGPLGIFEIDTFSKGTFEVAKGLSLVDGISIVGGGDTVAAINRAGVGDKVSHISTGGGAAIELIAGKSLPGIEVMANK